MKASLFFFFTSFLFSCTNSSSPTLDTISDFQWSLKSVTCECSPLFLEKGQYTYDFDFDNNQYTITNNTTETDDFLQPSGTYPLERDDEKFTLDEIDYYYSIVNESLILDQNGPFLIDAPIYELIK